MRFENIKFEPVRLNLTRWGKNLYTIQRDQGPIRVLCFHKGRWRLSWPGDRFESSRESAELFQKKLIINDMFTPASRPTFRQAALLATRDPVSITDSRGPASCRVAQIWVEGVQYMAIEFPSGERMLAEYQNPLYSKRPRLARNALEKLLDQT